MSEYTDRVDHGLKGLTAVSTGVCPGCPECMGAAGVDDAEDHEALWSSGEAFDEGGFSRDGCGICGSTRAGTLYVWHGRDDNTGTLYHFKDACEDCVVYLANGDEPTAEAV